MNANAIRCVIAAITLLFAITLCGCNDSDRAKIVGAWTLEKPEKLHDRVNSEIEDETLEEIQPAMRLIFKNDGTLQTETMMGSVMQQKLGQWSYVSYEPESTLMMISCNIQQQTTLTEVTFDGENSIELAPPNMAGLSMEMRFVRE